MNFRFFRAVGQSFIHFLRKAKKNQEKFQKLFDFSNAVRDHDEHSDSFPIIPKAFYDCKRTKLIFKGEFYIVLRYYNDTFYKQSGTIMDKLLLNPKNIAQSYSNGTIRQALTFA